MQDHRLIIYKRIQELKLEIKRYQDLLDDDPEHGEYYENRINELEAVKNFNEAIYYETGALQ